MAVLVDNDKQQRMMGLQEQDIAEIYEQSIEIMKLNEEVSKYFCLKISVGQENYVLRDLATDD